MKKIQKMVRQGDVLLVPVQEIPADAVLQKHSGKVVLAEGEATGHAHRIAAKPGQMQHFLRGDTMYLDVEETVALAHEEHAHIVLEPGKYEVRRQVEVWMDEVRTVAD